MIFLLQVSAYNLQPSPNNYIHPGKRPMSSMSTTIVLDKTGRVIAIGIIYIYDHRIGSGKIHLQQLVMHILYIYSRPLVLFMLYLSFNTLGHIHIYPLHSWQLVLFMLYFLVNTLQDSPYRFHAIPKPALRMRVWWLWKLRIIILRNIIIHINV